MSTMSVLRSLALMTSVPLLGGCFVTFTEVAMEGNIVQLSAPVARGRSARLKAGAPTAYWVGIKQNGEWYLRTTSHDHAHRFQGRIRATQGGKITEIKPTRMEHNDRVRLTDNEVVFDIKTAESEDGFDFELSPGACAEFDLRIDGERLPRNILVGAREESPGSTHFVACPQ